MKNFFDKSEIAIDLTSLLDVIFIVLLIVMCNQQFLAGDAKEKLEQAEMLAQEAEQVRTEYEQHAEKYKETDNYVLFIDVTATINSPANLSQRTICILTGAAEAAPYKIELAAGNEEDKYKELETYIEKQIAAYTDGEAGSRPIILTVNKGDDDILYRDETAIIAVFDRLKERYEYVYVR